MADKTIDQLALATAINDNDLFVLQQSATAKKLLGSALKQYISMVEINSIESVTFDAQDRCVITLTDGTIIISNSLKGPQGVSVQISSSVITGGHRLTIIDADHPSGFTIDVMDGADGTYVDHITRTSGTGAAGTTDTYTMYASDGSTIGTFTVYNGSNGTGGDMYKSSYDPQGTVETVGIPSYVATAIQTAIGDAIGGSY